MEVVDYIQHYRPSLTLSMIS